MKLTRLTNVLFTGVVAWLSTASITQPSQAQSRRGFYCDTSMRKPVTVYQNYRGVREPWIRWTSNYFTNAGYDPLTRCEDVSERLNIYRHNHQLRYVTTGVINGQNVICTADQLNGQCDGLILTLKPNEDPERVLENLFDWHSGALSRYGRDRTPYIDVRGHLEDIRE